MTMWRAVVPLAYWRIKHSEKVKFDLILPIMIAAIFCLPLLSARFRVDALGSLNIIETIGSFIGLLVGFFIAALAAVATFGSPDMDDEMPGPLVLHHWRNGVEYDENLSRRRFLSFLFGYLAFVSIFVYLFGIGFKIVYTYLIGVAWPAYSDVSFVGFWIVYVFLIASILSNTLLGLFYLTDRMHRPTSGVKFGKKASPESGMPAPAE